LVWVGMFSGRSGVEAVIALQIAVSLALAVAVAHAIWKLRLFVE
jgi:hypothetical protein